MICQERVKTALDFTATGIREEKRDFGILCGWIRKRDSGPDGLRGIRGEAHISINGAAADTTGQRQTSRRHHAFTAGRSDDSQTCRRYCSLTWSHLKLRD